MAERVDDEDAVQRSRSDVRTPLRTVLAMAVRLRLTVDADGADGVGATYGNVRKTA